MTATVKSTILMVNQLTKPELLSVRKYINQLLSKRTKTDAGLKKYTEEDFVKLIDKSIKQGKSGDVYSWADIRKEFHPKHVI